MDKQFGKWKVLPQEEDWDTSNPDIFKRYWKKKNAWWVFKNERTI